MEAATAETNDGGRAGRPLGVRVIPEIHNELKTTARRRGMTMEGLLHRILCKAFRRYDLIDLSPSDPLPARR